MSEENQREGQVRRRLRERRGGMNRFRGTMMRNPEEEKKLIMN